MPRASNRPSTENDGGVHRHLAIGTSGGKGTTGLTFLATLSDEQAAQLRGDERSFLLEPKGGYVGCFAPATDGGPCRYTSEVPLGLINDFKGCGKHNYHDPCFVRDAKLRISKTGASYKCKRSKCPSHDTAWSSEWKIEERAKNLTFRDEGSQRYYDFLTKTARSGGEEGGHGASSGASERSGGGSEILGYKIIGSEEIEHSKNGEPAGGLPSGMGNLLSP